MRDLTDTQKRRLWEEVQRDFPGDDTMQQVHYVRLLHYHRTRGLSEEEYVRFFRRARRRSRA